MRKITLPIEPYLGYFESLCALESNAVANQVLLDLHKIISFKKSSHLFLEGQAVLNLLCSLPDELYQIVVNFLSHEKMDIHARLNFSHVFLAGGAWNFGKNYGSGEWWRSRRGAFGDLLDSYRRLLDKEGRSENRLMRELYEHLICDNYNYALSSLPWRLVA